MKKNIKTLLIIIILFTLFILLLINPTLTIEETLKGYNIWINNIFSTLFFFFIITDLLINYGVIDILNELLKNIINKLFHIKKDMSYVIILSIFTGSPSNSKYIKDLLDNKKISINDSEYLLTFTHSTSILFILGTITKLLNNKKIPILILISIILSNFIIGFIIRPKQKYKYERINIKKTINEISLKNKNFINIITSSILNNFNTLILILGIIIMFLIFNRTISIIFNFNDLVSSILSGLIEMTQGVIKISNLSINLSIKASLITSIISFGGLSIHMQTFSILSNYKIKYKYYLISRIVQSILSGILVFIFINYLF